VTSRSKQATIGLLCALLPSAVLTAQSANSVEAAAGMSKIRIVRLSEVRGAVQLDRSTGRGFEAAMANLPIVEKNRLRTDQGVAEVEFEDNSTLRLAPDSVVEFPELDRKAEGGTVSTIRLLRGTAYVSLVKAKGNVFNLAFDQQNALLPPGSHVRLQTDDAKASLAVFDGAVQVEGPAGAIEIARKQTVLFHLTDQSQPTVERQIAAETYDDWDKDATGYHARTAAMSALSGSPYSYGLNDMMYYGSFMNGGSCGMMWQPYFVSAGWDPYSNGTLAFYPGAGYSWVSPYPWGWTPYHYGTWSFCPSMGWGWQPGGAWNGLNNIVASTGGGTLRFRPPTQAPAPGESTLTAVNLKPLIRSEVASSDSFVFRRDSAGLGVPRDTLGKLDKLSHQAVENGSSTTRIYLSAQTPTLTAGRAQRSEFSPVSIHRGSAPPDSEGGQFARGAPMSSSASGQNSGSSMSPSASSNRAGASSARPH
jgi:FecR protein